MAGTSTKPAPDFKETGFSVVDNQLKVNFFVKASGHDFSLTAIVRGKELQSVDLMPKDESGKKSTLFTFRIKGGSAEGLSPLQMDELKGLGISPAELWKGVEAQLRQSNIAKDFSRHKAR